MKKRKSDNYRRKCNVTASNLNLTNVDFKAVASTQTKYFVAIGCAAILLGYIQAAFWNMTAARQTRSIRRHLFRAIMHKEMAYFDLHSTGDLNSRLTDSIATIHHGLGDKVGLCVQYIGSCLAGFIIGQSSVLSIHQHLPSDTFAMQV